MGNAPINANVQKNTAKPLAITAVSLTLKLQKSKVLYLRDVLSSFADDDGCINYDHFKKGLKKAKFIKSREADVFDLLFTMWDSDGEDKILLKDLVVGIAPLACPEEGLGKILQFAMILSDQDKRGTIGHDELEDVLYSLDSTASYFGDPHSEDKSIQRIAATTFEDNKDAEISHEVCIRRLTFDPYVKRFVRGAARPRVSFKENLVEEYGENKTGEDNASPVSPLSMPLSPAFSMPPSPASVLASLLGGGHDGLSSWKSSKSSDGLQLPSVPYFQFQVSPPKAETPLRH